MALRLRHWIALAALACAAITVAKLPPRESILQFRGRPELPEQTALRRVERRLARANENLLLLEKRDSLLPIVRRLRAQRGSDIALLVDPRLPPAVRTVMLRIVESTWQGTAPHRAGISVAVTVVIDTAPHPRDLPRANRNRIRLAHFLPQATDGATCVALVSLGAAVARQIAEGSAFTPRTLIGSYGMGRGPASVLGPCAFYAAFGRAGSEITRWLEGSNYYLAMDPGWSDAPQPPGVPRQGWRWPTYWFWLIGDLDMVACAAGNRERCGTAALRAPTTPPPFAQRLAARWNSTLSGVAGSSDRSRWTTHPLGARAGRYLADMVAEFGPDRFASFWTSDLPVDSAFADATGIPIEDWTMSWARAQIGTPKIGPVISLASTLISLLVAGVFVGGSAFFVTRRQVT